MDKGLGRGNRRSQEGTKLNKPYIQIHMCVWGVEKKVMENLVRSQETFQSVNRLMCCCGRKKNGESEWKGKEH